MDQIIPIPINSNSVSVSETESEIKNPTTSRPTFDSFVSMIDSFTQLPTPLPLPLPYSEAEPGSVNYFGIPNNFEGNDHVYDQGQSFGLGLEPLLGLGFEGDQDLYDYNDKALLPFSGYDLPIDTNAHFDISSPVNSFSHTDTPLQQFDLYSPTNRFAHTEYTLPPALPFSTSFDQSTFPTEVGLIPFTFDTQPAQPEHLAVSPSGHWTPITPTSHLPPDL